MGYDYKPRFVPAAGLLELSNLWHLSRTALAGQSPTKYTRMVWASNEYHKAHPEISSGGAYKDLDGMLAGLPLRGNSIKPTHKELVSRYLVTYWHGNYGDTVSKKEFHTIAEARHFATRQLSAIIFDRVLKKTMGYYGVEGDLEEKRQKAEKPARKNPVSKRGAKKYYCVEQSANNAPWKQIAFFQAKTRAFEYCTAMHKAYGGQWRVLHTWPAGFSYSPTK